jgi:hypothetical protein
LRVERDDSKGARDLYLRCLEISRDIGDKGKAAAALMSLANVESVVVDDATALAHLSEAMTIYRETENKRGIGYCLEQIGSVQIETGDLDGARRSLEESAAVLREAKNERVLAKTLVEQGEVTKWKGDLSAARSLFEESLAMATKTGDEMQVLRCKRRLLEQLLFEKRFKEAQALAGELAASFQKKSMVADQAECVAYGALALLRQGTVDGARASLAAIASPSGRSPSGGWRQNRTIAEALITAWSGDSDRQVRRLRDFAAESRRRGDRLDAWRAVLAAAEIEIHAGRFVEARKRLVPLQEETRARGYELLAREAGDLLKSVPLQPAERL